MRPELTPVTGATAPRGARGAERSGTSGDRVSLSGAGAQLQNLASALEGVPVVDRVHVAAIREALVDGSYEINPPRIAQKLLGIELLLPDLPDVDADPA
jgi:negative regulator of flagellin synthesis FlgM